MRFVSVRNLRGRSAEVWDELEREGEMIITSNGRPIAVLASVTESDFEESLAAFRQARAVRAVTALQVASAAGPGISSEAIEAEINAVRAARHR